jgi:hypothetical protein
VIALSRADQAYMTTIATILGREDCSLLLLIYTIKEVTFFMLISLILKSLYHCIHVMGIILRYDFRSVSQDTVGLHDDAVSCVEYSQTTGKEDIK